jgi:hypothetical protein
MTFSQEELEIRQRLKDDFQHYASKCLKIRSKSGVIYPFALNKAQIYIHKTVEEQRARTGKVRVIILKGRQQGCSTYTEGRFYWRVTHAFGMRAFILTHEEEATGNLFEMAKRYHENCPEIVRPTIKASNAKELIFDALDSGYKLGTAGNKSVGRSSTIQFLHASEAAFYKHASEHAKGIMQTVPNEPGTEIFIESTANGVGNWFHQQWQLAESGISDYIPIFVPWFWQDEYRIKPKEDFVLTEEEEELKELYYLDEEQLAWRRLKIIELSVNGIDGVKSFKQEYPCNSTEAFILSGEDSYIKPEVVAVARKANVEPYGPLLIGVDPARFGDDRTAIIRRQGRVAFKLETHIKKDTMEITGIVHNIIEKEKPAKVFVDVCGLGAGVVDRLYELGHRGIVVEVNSATTARDDKHYANKRSELWGVGREWLENQPAKIPDDNALHADLCGTKYKTESRGRLILESKEKMKSRGIRSSDTADALLLTFALPVSAYENNTGKKKAEVAKFMTENSRKAKNIKSYAQRSDKFM